MPSLRQLLARHATLLVIDASSPRVEASLWRDGTVNQAAVDGEASAALPVVVARVLAEAGGAPLRIQDLDAVAFCDGPGSVLGIRLAAASLRVWSVVRPGLAAYSFHSLPLLAASHPGLTIIADA
ncbi:MAG: peptidase M22, partial [Burkholderiales bacterium]|nr:peptidase M22 [Opitutaceae bacterium]